MSESYPGSRVIESPCPRRFFAAKTANAYVIPFNSALSILRLSTKYHIPDFRGRALDELKKHFPSESLADFDENHRHRVQRTTGTNLTSIQVIRAINIAQEVDALELLPCAFSRLCEFELEEAFSSTPSISLDRADIRRYAIGRENLRRMGENHIFPFLFDSYFQASDRCTSPVTGFQVGSTTCVVWMKQLYRNFMEMMKDSVPFLGVSRSLMIETFPLKFCPTCSTHFADIVDIGRSFAWEQLPECFDLGSWRQLKQSTSGIS